MSVLTEQQKRTLRFRKGICQAEDGLVTAIQTFDDHERSHLDLRLEELHPKKIWCELLRPLRVLKSQKNSALSG